MSREGPFDARLETWPDLARRFRGSGILVGNGASRAVWDGFDYSSLVEIAQMERLKSPLGTNGRRVFDALHTSNFEVVLQALNTTSAVNSALGLDAEVARSAYQETRLALIEAVRWVHPSPKQVIGPVRRALRNALLQHRWVYSTNYDLLVYWAIMDKKRGEGFKDFFWHPDGRFDSSDTEPVGDETRVLFLHGGLHLQTGPRGDRKRHAVRASTLLELFLSEPDGGGWLPLFVTEGDPDSKRLAIARSEYLSFAYRSLVTHKGKLVVFGHSLSDQDAHLVDALNKRQRDLAIGVLARSDDDIVNEKARLRGRFPSHRLYFFDAATHPLGSEDVRVRRMANAAMRG